ncbi:unnamed protein product [Rotaria sordida]|uniref:Uncharacterized protein n=1 Tax=Rotaria sordida TaxID=392033 RepID=A0A815M6X7_9BILA|nr:unnamed protein product [Rotaria sordida]CAF1255062.1 unnamed protein product [Rotaria sordida]CAF1418960.1 unnamed protein product [Rotaria sordida]CAF4119546.1 unnamed protein product [Rotaria sordida]
MQYEQGSEKVDMINTPYIPVSRPLLLNEDPEIRRTRKILIIILGVCLALSVVGMINAVSGSEVRHGMQDGRRGVEMGQSVIAILFYSFGIFVAHRYYQTGLRVFAWLGIIELVIFSIIIIVIICFAITATAAANITDDDMNKSILIGASVAIFFVIIICIACLILTIIIVKFAFKLARLIDAKRSLTIQQI